MTSIPLSMYLGAALLALAYLMPGHYLPWASFQSQFISALGTSLVALGAAYAAAREGRAVKWSPLVALAMLSAAVPVLQWTAGQLVFLSDMVLPALYLTGFALALTTSATAHALYGSRWLDVLFSAFVAAAVVSMGIALLQWLGMTSAGPWIADLPPGGVRPFGNLGQGNHLAVLLALGLVGVLRLFEQRRWTALTTTVAAAWLALGLIMAQSRAGWVFIACLIVWWWAMRGRVRLRLGPVAVGSAVALFVAVVVIWEPLNRLALLGHAVSLEGRLQAGPRLPIWVALSDAALRAPWAGYGWGQVSIAQLQVAADHPPVGRYFQNAHNTLLDLALWAGLPFALLWLTAIVIWLKRRVSACRDVDAWCVLAAVAAIGVNAAFEFPLEQAYFLLPLGLLMGSIPSPAGRTWRTHALALGLPVLAMLGALFWIGAEYLKVEQANRDVRLMLAGFGLDKVPTVPPPDVRLLDGPREYHRFMITPARPGMGANEIDWMHKVMQRNAYPPAMMRYALAAGLNGRADEAALTLKQLCRMHLPLRCEEARSSWAAAQAQFPQLAPIPAP